MKNEGKNFGFIKTVLAMFGYGLIPAVCFMLGLSELLMAKSCYQVWLGYFALFCGSVVIPLVTYLDIKRIERLEKGEMK